MLKTAKTMGNKANVLQRFLETWGVLLMLIRPRQHMGAYSGPGWHKIGTPANWRGLMDVEECWNARRLCFAYDTTTCKWLLTLEPMA